MKTPEQILIDNGMALASAPWYQMLLKAMEEYAIQAKGGSGEETLFLVTYRYKNRTDASIHEDAVSAIDCEEAVTKVCANHNFEVEWHTVTELHSTPPVTPQDDGKNCHHVWGYKDQEEEAKARYEAAEILMQDIINHTNPWQQSDIIEALRIASGYEPPTK